MMLVPVHTGSDVVVFLKTIDAEIAMPGVGIARDHYPQSYERAGVFGPAFDNRQFVENRLTWISDDNFLTGSRF